MWNTNQLINLNGIAGGILNYGLVECGLDFACMAKPDGPFRPGNESHYILKIFMLLLVVAFERAFSGIL